MSLSKARLLVMVAVAVAGCAARADEIQPSPGLPPTAGEYVLPTICLSNMTQGACLENSLTSGISGVTDFFDAQGQHIMGTISLSSSVFAFDGMNVGPLLGSGTITGPIAYTVFGRVLSSEIGSFSTQLTSLDLSGNAGGHSIELKLDPSHTDPGQVIIAPSGGDFRISSFFDVFVELSLDHGAFIPDVASRQATLESTPEPGTAGLALLGLAGLVGAARKMAAR